MSEQTFYTIKESDVGKRDIKCFGRTWLVCNHWGTTLDIDAGKRVYHRQPFRQGLRDYGEVLQIENEEQFVARKKSEKKT